MQRELQEIFRDAYIRERKLNMMYGILADSVNVDENGNGFYARARDDQQGDLQLLQEINSNYGNPDIDANLISRMAEGLQHFRSNHKDHEDLVREILESEKELVDLYKNSLRYLTTDDQTRRQINRILTIKLFHKRELMDSLRTYTA